MFHIEEVLQLKDTEDVRLVVRRHAVTLVPGLATALLLIVLPFFFLFPMFSWGVPGISLFVVAVLLGIAMAARTIMLWNADVLIITTLRIVQVDQRGVFSRFVTEVPLPTIQDVSWTCEGVMNTFAKAGTLSIQSVGTSPNITSRRIGHPERVHELVNDLRHATSPRRTDLAPDVRERLRKLTHALEQLPPETLDRVEALIKGASKEQALSSFLDEKDTFAIETRTVGPSTDEEAEAGSGQPTEQP